MVAARTNLYCIVLCALSFAISHFWLFVIDIFTLSGRTLFTMHGRIHRRDVWYTTTTSYTSQFVTAESWLLLSKLNWITNFAHCTRTFACSFVCRLTQRNGQKEYNEKKNRCHLPGILCVWFETDLNAIFFNAMWSAESANTFAPPNWSAQRTICYIDRQYTWTNHIFIGQ